MALSPWYKAVTLRKEVREGRSFSPDEFAIALEQVVAGNCAFRTIAIRRSSSPAPALPARLRSTPAWCCDACPVGQRTLHPS